MKLARSLALAAIVALGAATPLVAADSFNVATLAELSGAGATVGTNWKNGVDLAIEEINAKGGILGKKIVSTYADTQTNPGVARAALQKALDEEPIAILGPIYSGSVKVMIPLSAEAEVPQIVGGEAADLTRSARSISSAPPSARTCRCPSSPTICATR